MPASTRSLGLVRYPNRCGETLAQLHYNPDSRREAKLASAARPVMVRPSAYNTRTSAEAEMELRQLIVESWVGGMRRGHRRQPKRIAS